MTSLLHKIERDTYLAPRTAGDLEALRTGGTPRLAKRVARRYAARQGFTLLRRWGR